MNRIPLVLAEAIKRGGAMNPAVVLAVGALVVVVVGGVLISRALRNKKIDAARSAKDLSKTFPEIRPSHGSNLGVYKSDDAKMICRLAPKFRELFPTSADFVLKPGWLYDEIMVARFDGYSERCEELLQEMIKVSQGKYMAAAVVGDTFDCRKMRTNAELPDDMRVSKVRLSGLVKVSTGEVMIAAIVA